MHRKHAEIHDITPTRIDGLRVLVVAESFLPQVNGVTNSVRRVLDHLEDQGHLAELVAPTGPDTYAGFRVTRVRGARLPFYKDFRIGLETRRRLRQVMHAFRPDVVHIASPATLGYQASRTAAELGIPTVAIYQTDMIGFAERYGIPGGARAMAALTRKIHTSVDLTLVPSSASLKQLEDLGVPGLGTWRRGVDLVQFDPKHRDPQLRARLAPDGQLLVGYVGRLAPEKEIELLAHLDDIEGIQVVVVGGGPSESDLRKALPHAHFLGMLHGEELGAAYASLDVFVHTGRHETFGQSLQEAMASGLPVVAPAQGGPVDVVDAGAGFLFPPGDGAEMAAYVRRLVEDDVLRARMAAYARTCVATRSWYAVNETLIAAYREVIGGGPRSSVRRAS